MPILAVIIRDHSIMSAMCKDKTYCTPKETAWNISQGWEGFRYALKTVFDGYKGYPYIGVCWDPVYPNKPENAWWSSLPPSLLAHTPIFDLLEEISHTPVYADSIANAFTVGESRYGAGKSSRHTLCVRYGSRISSGIMINRELYTGMAQLAGRMGHVTLYDDGLTCECGNRGCYERYASTTALVERAQAAFPTVSNGFEIMQEYHRGNPTIQYVLHRWLDDVVLGLSRTIKVLAPEQVVLGGGIFQEPYIYKQVEKLLAEKLQEYPTQVSQAELGYQACLLGISTLAKQHFDKERDEI